MRVRFASSVASLALTVACSPGSAQSSETAHLQFPAPVTASGIVVDSLDQPVRGAKIEYLALRNEFPIEEPSGETDTGGRFRIEATGLAVVIFRKEGFASQLIRLGDSSNQMRVVLAAAPPKEAIPVKPKASGCVSVGGRLCFPKVKGVGIGDIGGSIDAFERSYTVGRWTMIHGAGPSWGGPWPGSREVWSSVEYEEQIREGDGIQVVDARGITADGKRWRSVGLRGETAFYFDVDAKAAAVMDKVLDGLCLIVQR